MNSCIIKYIIFLLTIEKSLARINITITVASNKGGIKVKSNGTDLKLVSVKEIKMFNISDGNLRKGTKIELGKEPDEIFLKDPTDYGDVYHKYKWNEVKRDVHVTNAKIVNIKNKKVLLKEHEYINNSTIKSKVNINLHDTVETTVSTFWDKDGFRDDIYYNINITNFKTILFFKNKWMDNNYKVFRSIFGTVNVGYVYLEPGNSITAKLLAKQTYLLINVVYTASLVGNLMANYARLYGKYHFWAPSISNIMKAADLTNEFIIHETIEVNCYTDPVIDVIDKTTGKKIAMMFENRPFRTQKPTQFNSLVNGRQKHKQKQKH